MIWLALKFNFKFNKWWKFIFNFEHSFYFPKQKNETWIDYLKDSFGIKVRLLSIIEFGLTFYQ